MHGRAFNFNHDNGIFLLPHHERVSSIYFSLIETFGLRDEEKKTPLTHKNIIISFEFTF